MALIPGYLLDSNGSIHAVDPCNQEFTLCSLAFDISSDDYDDSGRRGCGPMVDCDGPANCEDCKERSQVLTAMLPKMQFT